MDNFHHTPNTREFVEILTDDLRAGKKQNKREITAIAHALDIRDANLIKELSELAIVTEARRLAHDPELPTPADRFDRILNLYQRQVNLSHRTSKSMLLQQYSTPAPLAYLAGLFCGINEPHKTGFEPSAGNGMLTIAGEVPQFEVNEIDIVRRQNLIFQGWDEVEHIDGSSERIFRDREKKYDVVITNPPFGSLGEKIPYDNIQLKNLDHLMALRALKTMKDTGRAAIIIGGHTNWDSKGRIQRGKNRVLLSYLYQHYYVRDVIQIDGKQLYSRMGTGFDVRLILIEGRKSLPEGLPPLKRKTDVVIRDYQSLYWRVMNHIEAMDQYLLQHEQLIDPPAFKNPFGGQLEKYAHGLNGPYYPQANSCTVLDTRTPDSMDFEIHQALRDLRKELGIPLEEFVAERLGYANQAELCRSLSAEQVDAVALAIYNIEYRNEGMIIGDQTGIGKGRVAAAMIRYAVSQGLKPIFFTEKANLFSDLYRDLIAIGAGHLRPFIVNGRDSKSNVKSPGGEVIYQAPTKDKQEKIFEKGLPDGYDFVMLTYSQIASKKFSPKKDFIREAATDTVIVLDESHNASGSSNTGEYLQGVLSRCWGVTYLSATYAKRPENMPVYAMKTAMQDANLSIESMISAIRRGGNALQEVISAQLVSEGQMIRRERSFEGIEVNYITLDKSADRFGLPDLEEQHRRISDHFTSILRELIELQAGPIRKVVSVMDKELSVESAEVHQTKGTEKAGADSLPYFSRVFQIINQMLLSIKAEAAAKLAIRRLKEGKKPVIALSSTLGSFIESLQDEDGKAAQVGMRVEADFAGTFLRGLETIRKVTVRSRFGGQSYEMIKVSELPIEAQSRYYALERKIQSVSSGISISPIDLVKQRIREAGFSVEEVTGRQYELDLDLESLNGLGRTVDASGRLVSEGKLTGVLRKRKKVPAQDAFRKFNNNQLDVLIINRAGSTGASAHAIPTDLVDASEVKQRVMIVLQPEIDINTEIQKRGRINRTGQIHKPIYDYLISAIPAEKRLMMMLQSKLKSLDANTSSNQKQSAKLLSTDDFLNKYGNHVVEEYLNENPNLFSALDLRTEEKEGQTRLSQAISARFVSGRVAVLPTQKQEKFYREVTERYHEYVDLLKQQGEYDLEVEVLDLKAQTLKKDYLIIGKDGQSVFGEHTFLEKARVKNLSKPMNVVEVRQKIEEALEGKAGTVVRDELLTAFQGFIGPKRTAELEKAEQKYRKEISEVTQSASFKKFASSASRSDEVLDRIEELKSEIETEYKQKIRKIAIRYDAWENWIGGLIKFFYPGRALRYHQPGLGKNIQPDWAVSLGLKVDFAKENPWAPSNIQVRLAIAGPQRYLSLPASGKGKELILQVKGASMDLPRREDEDVLRFWSEYVQKASGELEERYLITGNILQGFGNYRQGKLVSFTTHRAGEVRKGILMPKFWIPEADKMGVVNVPLLKALPVLRSMHVNERIQTAGGLIISKMTVGNYKVYAPGSKSKGGKYFLNENLMQLVVGGVFNRVSNQMLAEVYEDKLEEFVRVLQEQLGESLDLNPAQFNRIKTEITDHKPKRRLIPQRDEQDDQVRILELEAEALELELELLSL